MKLIWSIVLVVVLAVALSWSAPYLPDNRGRYPVIIAFVETNDMRIALDSLGQLPLPECRVSVIEHLKATTERLRSEASRWLIPMEQSGDVEILGSLWLAPGLNAVVSAPALNELKHRSDVYLVPNHNRYMLLDTMEPDETLSPMDIAWGVNHINAPDVWALGYTGSNVVVGILDTGVRYTHHDISGNMWTNPGEIPDNGVDDDGNGYVDDYYGYDFFNGDGDPMDDNSGVYHGTHCAGTIAGDGTSGTETGVAPDAEIMAIKVLGSSGSGSSAAVESGLQYALDMGAQVLSLSIGFEDPDILTKNYFREIFRNIFYSGVAASVAAGNGRSGGGHYDPPQDISSPADSPAPWWGAGEHTASIAVGAVYVSDALATFSSYGPTAWWQAPYDDHPYPPGLIKPDVVAPGVNIYSLDGSGDTGYRYASGTSMATPHLAGMLALMLSKNPGLTPVEIDSIVETTALPLGPAGKDSLYGSGRIRADSAMAHTPAPPFPILRYNGNSIDDPLGNDNGILDRGERAYLYVAVLNDGSAASAVTGTIDISNPYVGVLDADGSWGGIGLGESATNTADPFEIQMSSAVPVGYSFSVIVSVTSTGGYGFVDTFSLMVANYPRQYMDISFGTGDTFTVTNFGELGFFDPTLSTPQGSGFSYSDYNYLYGGGLFVGFSSDNVVTGEGGTNSEFIPIRDITTDSPGLYGDIELLTEWMDTSAGLTIWQRAIGWNSPPNDDFIVLRYHFFNDGSMPLTFYPGVYLDWDIHYESGWFDRGRYRSSGDVVFMHDSDTPPAHPAYVGLVGVTDMPYGSLVHNPTYVYPSGQGWADSVKFKFLSGALSTAVSSAVDDWSMILSAGAFTLNPGDAVTAVWGIVAGSDSSDFEANAAQARALITTILSVEDAEAGAGIPARLTISIYPNPFNSSCKITVEQTFVSVQNGQTGMSDLPARVEIYDLRGNVVVNKGLMPLDTGQGATAPCSGHRTFIWYPDKSNTSGVYLVRAQTADGRTAEKKIIYLK